MTELTFALLKYGFLILLWIFIWLAVRSLRKDIETALEYQRRIEMQVRQQKRTLIRAALGARPST